MLFRKIILGLSLLLFVPSVGEAQPVNCNRPMQTLQGAIDGANPGDTISVIGTCNENVVIDETHNNLTIEAQGVATIDGPDPDFATILIRGRGITIRGFTITGGSNGIHLRGGTAEIDNNIIEFTGGHGVAVIRNAFAAIIFNTIQNNSNRGISISGNSYALIGCLETCGGIGPFAPNTIQGNARDGIGVSRSSAARIVENTIEENGRSGVGVTGTSHAEIEGNTISDNSRHGISVSDNSDVALDGNDTGVKNARFGISCSVAGVVSGERGTLDGDIAATDFDTNCVDDLSP